MARKSPVQAAQQALPLSGPKRGGSKSGSSAYRAKKGRVPVKVRSYTRNSPKKRGK